MRKYKPKKLLAKIGFWITTLIVLGGTIAMGFIHANPSDDWVGTLLIVGARTAAALALVLGLETVRERRRKARWQHTVQAWKEPHYAESPNSETMARHLSNGALKHLAIKTFHGLGYRVEGIGEEQEKEIYIKLLNPDGQLEIVQCMQWDEPLGLQQISDLQIVMNLEQAVRGFIWAPGGFTSGAIHWAEHKPIILADGQAIGKLLERTYNTGQMQS